MSPDTPPADSPALRIEMPEWAVSMSVQRVISALGDARFVGGIVRDHLMGRVGGTDIDIATPLVPETVIERLNGAGIRTVPTGIDHGTVTALLQNEHGAAALEITTLRRDVRTDGRHAEVAFTDHWRDDAARRDFTINALYLDRHGRVWDYFGGIEDCRSGRIRFLGDPLQRIREDVLRLLRFYRFAAQFGKPPFDAAARQACHFMAPHVSRLSGERIRVELLKLLSAADPAPIIEMMIEDSVWTGLFQDIAPWPDRLARLVPLERHADPVLRLAALLPDRSGDTVADRLKSPTKERDRLLFLTREDNRRHVSAHASDKALRIALYRLGASNYRDVVLLTAAEEKTSPDRLLSIADNWIPPSFPLRGADLLEAGFAAGPEIGKILDATEKWWIERDFLPNAAACLAAARALGRA